MEPKEEAVDSKLYEMYSFKELISTIMDYYCLRSDASNNEEEKEGDSWKIGTKYENAVDYIIPDEIDDLVEQAFKTQLGKFISPGQ